MRQKWASILLCVAVLAGGQIPDTVIKSTTRLVEVNVVVQDKNRQPVRDLKKEDFVLTDNGVEQKITFLTLEVGDVAPRKAADLPPGLLSNRQENTAALPNTATAILLDVLNSDPLDMRDAKEGLLKFLGELHPEDRVAVYTLGDRLTVVQDFTSDIASLVRAVNRHKTQAAGAETYAAKGEANTHIAEFDEFLNHTNGLSDYIDQERRTAMTLKAILAIANRLAGLPGRKNLIWLSDGFPLLRDSNAVGSKPSVEGFSGQVTNAERVLEHAGIAIYPVDARGVIPANVYTPSMDASVRRTISVPRSAVNGPLGSRAGSNLGDVLAPPPPPLSSVDLAARKQIADAQSTMFELADRTGGRALVNSNDITGAIRIAMDDARVSYVIGYSPTIPDDGKFHEIKLKVKRAGVEERHRRGYYALPPEDPKLRPALLVNASLSPLLSTGLGMLAKMTIAPTPANPHAQIKVLLDAREVSFTKSAAGQWEANLDMLAVVGDDQGEILSQLSKPVRLIFTQDQYAGSLKNGFMITADVDAPEKSAKTRVVVRDIATGSLGSIDVPIASTPASLLERR